MSQAASNIETIDAPRLIGVWVFDPVDPEATERNFIFADGREETVDVAAVDLELVGREYAITEFGEASAVDLEVTIFLPFGDDHDVAVDYWRAAVRARRPINYRDNRGRLMYATLKGGVGIADGRAGTALSISLGRVDYDVSA